MSQLGVLLFALLSACAWFQPVQPPIVPVSTHGFQTAVPTAGTVVTYTALDGRNLSWNSYDFRGERIARDFITSWLHQRGVVFVTADQDALLQEQYWQLAHTANPTMRVGKLKGAAQIIDVRITSGYNDPAVTIKATSVETGEIVWTGSATMPVIRSLDTSHRNFMGEVIPLVHTIEKLDTHTMGLLACHALRTAFGLQPPGTYPVRLDRPCAEN